MDEFRTRLTQARIAAGYRRKIDAISAFGFPRDVYYQHENGHRTPDSETSQRYARAYRVSLEWLLTGRGEMKPAATDPVIAEIIGFAMELAKDRGRLQELRNFAAFQAQRDKQGDIK